MAKKRSGCVALRKTPEPILEREKKIFALGRKLIRAGVSKEELQAISKRIAGVREAVH